VKILEVCSKIGPKPLLSNLGCGNPHILARFWSDSGQLRTPISLLAVAVCVAYVRWLYCPKGKGRWASARKQLEGTVTVAGGTTSDPLGPLLFCLGSQLVVRSLQQVSGFQQLWYIGCDCDRLVQCLHCRYKCRGVLDCGGWWLRNGSLIGLQLLCQSAVCCLGMLKWRPKYWEVCCTTRPARAKVDPITAASQLLLMWYSQFPTNVSQPVIHHHHRCRRQPFQGLPLQNMMCPLNRKWPC